MFMKELISEEENIFAVFAVSVVVRESLKP